MLEFSSEARTSVDAAAELIDSAVGRLTAVLAASCDPRAAQAVRSLTLAQERLTEISALFGWIAGELPIFVDRLGRAPNTAAACAPAVPASYRRDGRKPASVTRPGSRDEPVTEARSYVAWWGTTSREIADAGAAESAVREAADRLLTGGPRGIAIRVGDGPREQAPLRIDIDTAAGRAAVSWQGAPGVESGVDAGGPLTVVDDPSQPPATIPPERARVTPGMAIRAAREYVETGQRPTCLNWNAGPGPAGVDLSERTRPSVDSKR